LEGAIAEVLVTRTLRWTLQRRPTLFEGISYIQLPVELRKQGWTRLGSAEFGRSLAALRKGSGKELGLAVADRNQFELGFKGNALYYLSVFIEPPLVIEPDGSMSLPTMMGTVAFADSKMRYAALAVLLSKFAFVWWGSTSDNLNVTKSGILSTPVSLEQISRSTMMSLVELGKQLEKAQADSQKQTMYRGRQVFRYDISALRPITDEVDLLLADELQFDRSVLELEYVHLFKGTEDSDD
jgi:hypothetical protein